MGQKIRKRGSPPGQSKPLKRTLDLRFPARLREAMLDRWPGKWEKQVSLLAAEIKCTRQTLLNYVNGKKPSGEPLLLLAIADTLNIEWRWLLTGNGPKGRVKPLSTAQVEMLKAISKLVGEGKGAHDVQ